MRVYVDTCALLALYQNHPRTREVEAWCKDAKLVISRLTLVEFRSAIFNHKRRKTITLKQARDVIHAFRQDLGKYMIREIGTDTWRMAGDLIEKYAGDRNFRSLDAVQLATAASLPRSLAVEYFVTLDVHPLADVAEQEGFAVKP